MSGGYRSVVFAAFCGLVFVTFATGIYIGALTEGQGQYEDTVGGQTGSGQSRNQPQQSAIDRAGLPGLAERLISNPQPQNGEDNEKRDLAAQEATAVFTFWMVIVALLQTIVAGFGIYYIRRTIRQGQAGLALAGETKNETIRIGEAQTRAYLVVQRARVADVLPGKVPHISFRLKNTGQTPAYELRCRYEVFIRTGPLDERLDTPVRFTKGGEYKRRGSLVGAGEYVTFRIRNNQIYASKDVDQVRDQTVTKFIAGVVSYRDVFRRRRLLTFYLALHPHNMDDEGRGRFGNLHRGNIAN